MFFNIDAGNAKAGDAALEAGKKMPQVAIWHIIGQPRILLLCLAASIRHCGEFVLMSQNNELIILY